MFKSLKKALKTAGGAAPSHYSQSYSQYGEDQIILALLYILKLSNVNFIDIGANDPFKFNNTAILNEQGIHGINIEPDPGCFEKLKNTRKKDVNLNIGISSNNGTLSYYRFEDTVYNTFSETENKSLLERPELKSLPTLQIEVRTYNDIVREYLNGLPPTLLFMDTEGLDEQIIDAINFKLYAPKIICIETFSFGQFRKDNELIDKIKEVGYHVHADTFVNTIFMHNSLLPYPKQ